MKPEITFANVVQCMVRLAQVRKLLFPFKCTCLHFGRKGKKTSSLSSVAEFLYSEITPTGTLTYCFLSYFESKSLINIGSLESLSVWCASTITNIVNIVWDPD